MSEEFDPYRQWLGRTARQRPLNHYQLLGLPDFDADKNRIENAEMIEMAKVLRHEGGPHAAIARRLCEELQEAVATLCDPSKKAAYDAQLRATASATPPLNYYQLLNLRDFEDDRQRIENAEMIEMARALRVGDSQACEALERAVRTLLDPDQRAAYDASLRATVVTRSPTDATLPPAEESPSGHDFSADLKLNDEEEEPVVEHSPPELELPSYEPAVPSSEPATRSTSLWQDTSNADDLATAAKSGSAVAAQSARGETAQDSVSAAIDQQIRRATAALGQPEEPPARVPVSLPAFSMPKIPLKPVAGAAAAIVLGWAVFSFLTRGEPTGQLAGKVMFQGAPAAGAEMQFESTANPDNLFIGIANPDGSYYVSYRALDGLPVGRYRVTITHYTLKGGQSLPEGEEGLAHKDDDSAVQKSVIFEQDIAKGRNAIDFELTQGQELKPQG